MIRTFANDTTQAIFEGKPVDGLPVYIQEAVLMRLQILNSAETLRDLQVVFLDRLELATDERQGPGKHCIVVIERARICFRWRHGEAYDVELYESH